MNSLGIYLIVKLDTLERLENTLAVTEYLATNFKGVDFVYPYERYFYDTSEELRKLYIETRNLITLMEYRAFMKNSFKVKNGAQLKIQH